MKSIKKIMQQNYITSEEYQRIKSLLSCTYIWDANINLYKKLIEKNQNSNKQQKVQDLMCEE